VFTFKALHYDCVFAAMQLKKVYLGIQTWSKEKLKLKGYNNITRITVICLRLSRMYMSASKLDPVLWGFCGVLGVPYICDTFFVFHLFTADLMLLAFFRLE